jgi:hypothetical protein
VIVASFGAEPLSERHDGEDRGAEIAGCRSATATRGAPRRADGRTPRQARAGGGAEVADAGNRMVARWGRGGRATKRQRDGGARAGRALREPRQEPYERRRWDTALVVPAINKPRLEMLGAVHVDALQLGDEVAPAVCRAGRTGPPLEATGAL